MLFLSGQTKTPNGKARQMATKIIYTAGTTAPHNYKALDSVEARCTVCARKLGANPFYFEVNTSWVIIVPGSDTANSQGGFPVGNECAKKFDAGLLVKIGG